MATYHLRVKNDTQPSGKKVSAKRHADYILREDGKAHADYINREGAQGESTDCVFKANQLPKWAKGSAQKFFSAASRYESKGNRRYKEIELSLPNELTLEQNRQIVDKFIANHLSNHYYAYAIYKKAGELSGERHPHVHIMFSERLERVGKVQKCSQTTRRPGLNPLIVFNAILWILSSGAPWRDLLAPFGSWNSIYHKFRLWCAEDVFENILQALVADTEKYLLVQIDSTFCKVHQYAAGARKKYGNSSGR